MGDEVGGRGRTVVVPPLTITLLGRFQVAIGEVVIPEAAWQLQKARNLVKSLALAPGHRLTRDELRDARWPDKSPAAAQNLYSTLTVLRRVRAPIAPLRLRGGALTLDTAGSLHVD